MEYFAGRRFLSSFGRRLEKVSPYIEIVLLPLFVIGGYYLGRWLHWWEDNSDGAWVYFVKTVAPFVFIQIVLGIFLARMAFSHGYRKVPMIQTIIRVILLFMSIDTIAGDYLVWPARYYYIMWYIIQFCPGILFGIPMLLHWWAYCCVEPIKIKKQSSQEVHTIE